MLGAATQNVLPRSTVVGLSTVRNYFPEAVREHYSGANATAAASPTATRSVIFINNNGSKKVTVSVDRYATSREASSAYREAVAKSKIPGFAPLSVPQLGQATFAGTITRGAETHVGLGALTGNLIIGVTLAGYPATGDNIHRLVALAQAEMKMAKGAG